MKKLLGGFLTAAMMLSLTGCGSKVDDTNKDNTDKTFTIGIVQHITHPALDSAVQGFKDTLEAKGFKVNLVEKNAQGDTATNDLITKQFVSDKVDMIYAVGTPSALSAVNATLNNPEVPVVFNAVTDPVDAQLVKTNEAPGSNVTGVSDAAPLEKQLKLIREMLPDAKKIGMIYNIGEPNGKIQVEQVKKLATTYGFTIEEKGISASTEVASAAQQLADSVDCIYNITDNMVASAIPAITDKANAKNIPVFAAESGQMGSGSLASDSISYEKLGNQAGEMAYDILVNGKKPAEMAVQSAQETTLIIDKKVAEQLKITISEDLSNRATFAEE